MYSVSILVSVEETLKPLVDRLYTRNAQSCQKQVFTVVRMMFAQIYRCLLEVAEENILLKQLDYLTKCNLDL